MRVLREYRLGSLVLLIVFVLAVFLAFYFVFVLAPFLTVLAFYPIFLLIRNRRERRGARGEPAQLRRIRLEQEATARRETIERGA